MTTLYGIKNCDTVKKARTWLETNNIDYTFHDFKTDAPSKEALQVWESQVGDALVNKRSTTWKQLSEEQRAAFNESPLSDVAIQQLQQTPTLIKRPVIHTQDTVLVGFKADIYQNLFS